ncbi:hypothetical protein [Deinococcus enclensis]|uniref:Uncharacterized protein n=1 Tax=Deinococcus enclensis TaxID=1049582 RepID=A0ABT9ME61_9DEIO|nr:hypothetical protein [Deinococcus enclensis]MDP9764896.1 hypothetical protein [Deinococcus enclensis]
MVTRKAITQALHLSLGQSYQQITQLTGDDAGLIRKQILTGKAWASRPAAERTEAIAAARALIEEGGR